MSWTTNLTSHRVRRSLLLVLAIGTIGGCGDPLQTEAIAYARRYGLELDRTWENAAQSAISTTNAILSVRPDRYLLRPGWLPSGGGDSVHTIPVLLLGSTGLSRSEIARVDDRCTAVLIQGPALERWLAKYQSEDSLNADPAMMLTFLLLHEVGHLEHSDCGHNAVDGSDGTYNVDKNAAKAAEVAADHYAAESLLRADHADWKAKLSAMNTEMAITTFSFLVAGERIVTYPGASVLPTPDVFWDSGLSHPNLEWRLLEVSYELHPTADSKQLLAEFEAARDKASDVIYSEPSTQ